MNKKSIKKYLNCCMAFLSAGAFYCVCYYIFHVFRNEITSDCTDTILWAEAMVTSGKVFSPTFKYAGFIPFGGQLLMYPFVKVLGVTMNAQMFSMLVFAIIFAGSVFFCSKEIFKSCGWAFFTVFMMLSTLCVSKKLREIFWGHIIYYSLGVLFLAVALLLVCKIIRNDKKKEIMLLSGILGLWMFLTAADGLLSLVQCMIPLLGAVVLLWCFNEKEDRNIEGRLWIMAVIMIVGSVFGYLAGILLHGDMAAGYAQAYSSFDGSSDWTENFMKLIPQWYTLLGVDVVAGEKFMSANGIINLIRIAYATLIVVIPAVMLFNINKIKEAEVKVLIFAHWVMTLIIMMGYVFGRLSGGNWRLSPLLCTAVIILAAFIRMCLNSQILKRFGMLVAAVCIFVNLLTVFNVLSIDKNDYKNNIYYGLSEYLKENELTYGYATFWNANVITLLSDSNVKVRNVEISDEGSLTKGLYQSESYWFDEQENQNNYFLLLTRTEFAKLFRDTQKQLGGYYDYLEYDNYYILIYSSNIF